MPAKKVALFVDVESMHHRLRSLHHRYLDPALLLETAGTHGKIAASAAIGDWASVPEDLKQAFTDQKVETIQVDRATRTRESGGRRREVLRDGVDLEILARMIEVLFPKNGGPEIDMFVLATGDDMGLRTVELVQERFDKPVRVIGVEGTLGEALEKTAESCESLPMPELEPKDLEGLAKLIPLLEDLEQRKRYLNFKYIRESVVRRLNMPKRSFDAAERLLCDAIACGVLLKIKVDDKYNAGQQFTAYALNRECELFEQHGSGEPAPTHEDAPAASNDEAGPTASVPSLGSKRGRGSKKSADKESSGRNGARRDRSDRDNRSDSDRSDNRSDSNRSDSNRSDSNRSDRDNRSDSNRSDSNRSDSNRSDNRDGDGRKRRRRRRGRTGSETQEPAQLSAGGGPKKAKKKQRGRGRGGNHQQDRVGRSYEAPSRFITEDPDAVPQVKDEDIDEDRILRALGDA